MYTLVSKMWSWKWTALKLFMIFWAFITHYGVNGSFFMAIINALGVWGVMIIGEFAYCETVNNNNNND